jgi:hypothetical protein
MQYSLGSRAQRVERKSWRTRATGGIYAPRPSSADLLLAEESRGIKVFVYDFAGAGFAPPLNATDAYSAACDCAPSVKNAGTGQDPCNNGVGRMHTRAFAAPFQGNYWGNFRGGQDNLKIARVRLESGYRRVTNPAEAQLFFVPLEVYDTCQARKKSMQAVNRECGIDYRRHDDFVAMWRWLLQQDAFVTSDGSDHFMFTEFPYKAGQASYFRKAVRAISECLGAATVPGPQVQVHDRMCRSFRS